MPFGILGFLAEVRTMPGQTASTGRSRLFLGKRVGATVSFGYPGGTSVRNDDRLNDAANLLSGSVDPRLRAS